MAVLVRDCFHCKARSIGFTLEWSANWRNKRGEFVAAATCGNCGRPISFMASNSGNSNPPTAAPGNIETNGYKVGDLWPQPEAPTIPRHVPEEYVPKLTEAEGAFGSGFHTGAAGLYRSLIDVTTKRQLRAAQLSEKGSLFDRLDRLADNHVIPKSVADWAHEVRVIGNEGLHEEASVSPEDCAMARSFAQTYLRYAFELPGDVAARRGTL